MTQSNGRSEGYLIVSARAADGALPLENVKVTVRSGDSVISSMITDRSGRTEKLTIPTPPLSNSLSPGNGVPFSQVTITAERAGYYTNIYKDAPIYPTVTTIQQMNMLPLPEYLGEPQSGDIVFDENKEPNL